MGDDKGSEEERPEHTVTLDEYWIYKYPVTVAQYERYCRDAGVAMPQKPRWG
jgi:formylglycine-generating enzyme